jgi:putative restriction endonuclease
VKLWVANTDRAWFSYLASLAPDEVNFWQPNAVRPVTLEPGAPWLFKLHMRHGGWIVGGAFFATYTTMSPRFAWDAFGQKNGAPDRASFLRSLRGYSERPVDELASRIGASVLVEPFFLPEERWIPSPADWSSNLTRGKRYDTSEPTGAALWAAVLAAVVIEWPLAPAVGEVRAGYGAPTLVAPRLGQGAFRVMVTDAYERRCVVTGERTLPVLEAAHIKPYALVGRHEISNGLLLRADLHKLFDLGYVTVSPHDLRLEVSARIHEQFENGREYYALHGRPIRGPRAGYPAPSREMLDWHATSVFQA